MPVERQRRVAWLGFCRRVVGIAASLLLLVSVGALAQDRERSAATGMVVPTPPRPTIVPDIAGSPEIAAHLLLRVARLTGRNSGAEPAPKPRGTVLRSNPPAGSQVERNSTVDYWVASGDYFVPDVHGLTQQRAERELAIAGFKRGTIQTGAESGTPGQVIGQRPAAGTRARIGSEVALTVSGEIVRPTGFPLPDIIGLPEDAAVGRLAAIGLDAQFLGTEPSTAAVDSVLRTRPIAGTRVEPGDTVGYWLSAAKIRPRVPDVRGLSLQQAKLAIDKAGYRIGDVDRRIDKGRPGRVLGQLPAAGTEAKPGTAVNVTVSKRLLVPDVVGRSEADAIARLGRVELRAQLAGEEAGTASPGTVSRTEPIAGTPADANAIVRYWLVAATQPPPPPVPPIPSTLLPDVVGLIEDDARQQLAEAGHRPQRSGQELSPRPQGTVLRTNPLGGTEVAAGTSVGYWVASGENQVPNLDGQSTEAATTALEAAGFLRGSISRRHDDAPPGQVVGQQPVAGTIAKLGTAVVLTIAESPVVMVPDLRGQLLVESESALKNAGLTMGPVEHEFDFAQRDEILGQNPGPGIEVARGTAVGLRVSKGWLPLALAGAAVLLLGGGVLWWKRLNPVDPGPKQSSGKAPAPMPVEFAASMEAVEASAAFDEPFRDRGPDVRLRVRREAASVSPPESVPVLRQEVSHEPD